MSSSARPRPVEFGPWRRPVRFARVSGFVNTRSVLIGVVATIVAAAAFVAAVSLGKYSVPFAETLQILRGVDTGFSATVVLEWRLPRAVAALGFGAALGISGAIFQSVTRNPLGSPDVIGLSAGAFTGVLCAMAWFETPLAVTVSALLGGLAAGLIVYVVAYRKGLSGARFVVVGIAVSAALTAINQMLLLRMSTATATTASIWAQGTLVEVRWESVTPVLCIILLLCCVVVPLAPALGQLELGDNAAASTGVRVERARLALLCLGILLTAVVTSITGPIAFVALVAPQLARLLSGAAGATLLGSAATGALLLSVSDVVSAHLFPASVPVGVVTAVIGGVYLLWLIIAKARQR
ncbi:FecCD family ABC transporter permease [Leucobacter chinensis]|uniref:FecCD family ABC transporter permease n=1 Tax=Leucobacter chinensis TaxID=2851010 RepID=UPI001C2502E6|nr:iron chelate uptake ABC transporter family permease subunit [Leucobacter chinensis]